ncbi:hypothetical protein HWQ46_19200 [Shewanella sp. D64]|nr:MULTISPECIES: hypothetical protein [unclassified Shewanella]MEC4727676.1 hypothetical protein [Shewanella sp. D64]MEC4739751.1 hypothetical protein [Shewanella sp. E94]WBJ94072.1 hypothetical protein HWQ47_19515 [Shewanella sp. MTB7]
MPSNNKVAPAAGMLAIQVANIWTSIFEYLLYGRSNTSDQDKVGVK